MGRPRRNDRHLPPCVYPRHGAYWLVKRGKWTMLGHTIDEMRVEYDRLHAAPVGSMPYWFNQVLAHLRRRESEKLAKATLEQYEIATRKLTKAFAEFKPDEVRPKHVAEFKRQQAAKPNMANRCLTFLRITFDHLVESEVVDSNPCLGIRRYKERKRDRLISLDELTKIYGKSGPRLQVIIDPLIRTGRRVTDVLRIRRADLLEEGIRFQDRKTGKKGIVPWTPELRAVVARYVETINADSRCRAVRIGQQRVR